VFNLPLGWRQLLFCFECAVLTHNAACGAGILGKKKWGGFVFICGRHAGVGKRGGAGQSHADIRQRFFSRPNGL